MTNYEELLESAYKNIKPVESSRDRFEVPEIEGHIEGNKTIITNFLQICNYLRRNPEHLEKFLQKELAAPSKIDGQRLIFIKKIPKERLTERINYYIKEYVTCKECGKPDTELIKQDSFIFMHCLACGAKHSIVKI